MLNVDDSRNVWKNWSPRVSNRYEVYSREHYWSPASLFFQHSRYEGGDALPTKLEDRQSGKQIAMAHHTALYYLWRKNLIVQKMK